jgi:hypothetical protein
MSRVIQYQSDFTSGELDPLLRGRIDIPQYSKGLAKATNVTIQPQGGAKRRPGSIYVDTIPSAASPQNGVRLVHFEFSVTDSYMLLFTSQRMYVYKAGALITNINGSGNDYLAVTNITSSILSDMNWTQSADTLIVVHPDVKPQKIVRGASDSTWTVSDVSFTTIPKYAFTLSVSNPATTLTPSAVDGKITLTAGAATWTAGVHEDQYVNDTVNFGRARITSITSTTVANAVVETPFFNTSAIASGNWSLETGYVDAWSSGKGWPRSVTFHEGRLYFGGSKNRPSTIWGSKVGQYFDFDKGEALDDDMVEATLDTNSLNVIVEAHSGRNLQFFSTGGEFYVPQTLGDPITPSNIAVKMASRNGAKSGIKVQGIDGGTLYIQRQGKSLNEFQYTDVEQTYVSAKISLLSGHLLKTPKHMAIRRATSTDEGDFLLVVNQDDGAMGCWMLLRSQGVIAGSEWITDGSYIDVGVDVDTIYTVVKRSVGSPAADAYFLEKFSDTATTDSSKQGGVASSVASSHLKNKTVKLIEDGVVQADQAANGSGAITFPRASASSYEMGLDYSVVITTMPVEPRLASGNVRGFKKRIFNVNAIVHNTQAMTIAGTEIPFRSFGPSVLDAAVPEYTGIKSLRSILGYSHDASVTIGQSVPLKMTVLSIDYRVSVGQ